MKNSKPETASACENASRRALVADACQKCGGISFSPSYCSGGSGQYMNQCSMGDMGHRKWGVHSETLHITCDACGFIFNRATLDAVPDLSAKRKASS